MDKKYIGLIIIILIFTIGVTIMIKNAKERKEKITCGGGDNDPGGIC